MPVDISLIDTMLPSPLAFPTLPGPIDAKFDIQSYNEKLKKPRTAPPAAVVGAVSSALFWYLERTIPGEGDARVNDEDSIVKEPASSS